MAFDLSTAKPVKEEQAKFDLSTAQPITEQPTSKAKQPTEEESWLEKAEGYAGAGLSIASSVIAEPIAGAAGYVRGLYDPEWGAETVKDVRERLTYEPRSESGKRKLQEFGEVMEPVSKVIEKAEQFTGDVGYEIAGPAGGAFGSMVPTAVGEALGVGAGRRGISAVKSQPDITKTKLVEQAGEVDVPLLTTDLYSPSTKFGQTIQEFSENLGPLGSGTARISQQKARMEAVTGLADELEIELDSPFADSIVKSLNTASKKRIDKASRVRGNAVDKLNQFGDFKADNTLQKIEDLLSEQSALKETANQDIISLLNNYKKALQDPGNFEQMKNFRTQIIKKRNAFDRAEDTSPRDTAQAIKSALDKDMLAFARTKDRAAAKDWLHSNRMFANEADLTKRTELKRILDTGETTPEQVVNILKRGRLSELNRLNNSLTPKGKVNAQKALIQDALVRSKFFDEGVEVSPDRFLNVINTPNFQKARKVFFTGADKDRIDGLVKVLNATKRAQEATSRVRTGEKAYQLMTGGLAGIGAGYLAKIDPLVGASGVALTSAILKSYESKPFRNLLLKLKGSKQGSKAETETIDAIVTAVAAELQAAKQQEEEK